MKYVLGDAIHRGLYTRIVEALDPRSNQPLVLKAPNEMAPDEWMLNKLRQEYAMLSEAQGPGVVRAVELLPFGAGHALVMERWGQSSLGLVLQRGPLPLDKALCLGAAIARVLGRVHRKGLIHRDIKPHNILVDAAQCEIRLIDFGIAVRKSVYVEESAAPESLAGTLSYIAPEQTGRINLSVDSRADLYSLGVTLYQMLTGSLPFASFDLSELIHAHIARTPTAPHEHAPAQQIPAMVSTIVLKLMAKSAEDRYQTAEGVAFDLERAAQQWKEAGRVEPFSIGTQDWGDRIRKPSRLFGREAETAALQAAFARTAAGAVELLWVQGSSGVGKSALIQTLRESLRARQGIFAPGKFDQLQRGTPYLALSQALRSVVRRRLADPAAELVRWQAAWREAAGSNGRILVDLIPELVHILGEPKPVLEVGPLETKNRFQQTVQRFVRSIATAEHPLVLFLDDLQWADPASLVLLEALLADSEGGHLLVIGASRDDEVTRPNPVSDWFASVQQNGLSLRTLKLLPLGEQALSAMVADMLGRSVTEVEALARLIRQKTDGSPFFAAQLLQTLHEQRLLCRNVETGHWDWQSEDIERAGITDNVASLLTRRLADMSEALQTVLQIAACLGGQFALNLLTGLVGQTSDEVGKTLAEAVREGLLLHEEDATQEAYAFVHDRVQQAAYELRSPPERLAVHLRIGRQLRDRYGADCTDEELFGTLYHRNRTVALLTSSEEKRDLAAQNLRAGGRAKASTAYAAAVEFFTVAQQLLGESGWVESPTLAFQTHLGLAEALIMTHGHKASEPLFRQCIERAPTVLERAHVVSSWILLLMSTGDYALGVEQGLDALDWLERPFPRTAEGVQQLFGQLLGELEVVLEKMTLEDWLALPVSTDRTHELVCTIIERLGNCGFLAGNPMLFPCCILMVVTQTLRHGLTKSSMSGNGLMGVLLATQGKLSLARKLVEPIFPLVERYEASRKYAISNAGGVLQFWIPLAQVRALWQEAERVSMEEGDTFVAECCNMHGWWVSAIAGENLPQLWQTVTGHAYRNAAPIEYRTSLLLSFTALSQPSNIDAAEEYLDAMIQRPWSADVAHFFVGSMAAFTALHLCADAWAARRAMAIEPLWMTASGGGPPLLSFTAALCIATAHCLTTVSTEERPVWQEKLTLHTGRLAQWAESCPATFLHLRLLVDAGRARLEGRLTDAERLYDQAIADANNHGFVNDEALGLRLAGEYYLAQGKNRTARAYLSDAYDAYVRWGALAAAARIRAKYPNFFPIASPVPAQDEQTGLPGTTTTSLIGMTTTTGPVNARLDAASMLRAAQALSSDMVLDSLLGRMLRLLAENAGADRAVLALVNEGELRVEAELQVQSEQLSLGLHEALAGSPRLPVSVVQYAERSREPVLLGQASSDSRFDGDSYLQKHHPPSVLAVPLVHQGRLAGVIYLEHSGVPNAFVKERVELVALLASQAATAVENARLYAQVQAASQELQRVNQGLEEQVAARTAALQKALSELWSEMDLAQKIQTVLLPKGPGIAGYEMAALMRPADQVGGDYYDVFRRGEQEWVLIGDVSGHGVPAGLCMMMIQATLRAVALTFERLHEPLTPRRLLGLVNEAVENNLQQIGHNQYMTITALCLEGGRVRYAGLHQDLLIYRLASHQVERVETQGVWIGVAEGDISEFLQDQELRLDAGDVLLLYTDGYTEAKVAGRQLETEGLSQVFAELCGRELPSAALIEGLLDSLKPAVVLDDVTLIALRRLSAPMA